MKSRKFWYVIAISVLCLVAMRMAMAQEQGAPPDMSGQEQGPPPGAPGDDQAPPPGAARVSMINGEVSTMRGDSGEWVAAVVNAPVVQGDTVATAGRSRAEVQLDYANLLRLNENADVKIADLSQKHIQVQVASGVVTYTVLKGSEAGVEIDTPNMAVIPQGEGEYRIQIDADSQTEVTVRKGRAQVSTPDGSTTVERGQVIYVRGADNPEYQIANASPADEWDRWNSERDRTIEQSQSLQYTNRYYAGAQDLDQYGQWQDSPDYGNVWVPNVSQDWTPYSDGNWTWEPYWGWTWVSYEPWGWAPYHYGRWGMWGSRWCWWPGVGVWGARPLWAPAYVSFLGFGMRGVGFGMSLGFGFGSIGWLPLGPFERPHPWWGYHNGFHAVGIGSMAFGNGFNRGVGRFANMPGRYNSNLQAALTNPNVRRGITTMPADQFGRGISRGYGRGVDAATLQGGRMVQGTLPIVPTRASLMPGNRLARPSAIPSRAVGNTHFFSRSPVAARTESFSQRAAQIQQMVRQNPLGNSNIGARQGMNNTGRLGNAGGAGSYGNANRPGYSNPRPATPYNQGQSGVPGIQRNGSYYSNTQPRSGYAGGGYQVRPSAPQQGYNQGGWQRFSGQSQAAPSVRGGGWNAPAPRSQYSAPNWANGMGARGEYSGRPSLNMNKQILVQRNAAPPSYGGGGRAAPSGGGGGRGFSGGGGHSGGGGGHGGGGRR